ncbi:putative serine protease PepD [Flavimobilis soli]|uniref:Putative serine protease PepD n=1 Tax=Flavimobilis soli TaxID=442709 RepID=A0A2A9EC72_9MICO|nr:trypsin-like peptidase domain-containing protein [Flavimobilis soli]PFG36494.1 putative serine protease PepD [Flavimobilis soli]
MNDNITEPVPAAPQPGPGTPGERAEAPSAGPVPPAPQPPTPGQVPAPPAETARFASPSGVAPTQALPAATASAPYAQSAPHPSAPSAPHAYAQVQQPYGGGRPGAAPGGPGAPGGPAAPGASFSPQKPARPKRVWPAVVSTAAVTALLVGGGTAALTTSLLDDTAPRTSATSTVDGLGKTSPVTVDSVTPAAWESVAAAVAPTVVAIDVETASGGSQGSGVIYDTSGHIITNNHVVAGARDDKVTVTLSDGRLYEAKIVGLDASTDLGVIKIVDPPADLVAATFADSEAVVVGNAVMAVGNPLGLAHTVTTGIVSAVARPVTTAGEGSSDSPVVTNAIQIDAAINPGNSGGPLFDANGHVIGITSSIATLSSGSQSGSIGLGFAIPSNQAKSVGDQLIANGVAEHAFLGVTLSDATATVDGVTRRGALVREVTSGSAADKAGIQKDDVVIAIDGEAVSGYEFLTAAVRERVAGDQATLTIVRDGASKDVTATLDARPEQAQSQQPSGPGRDGETPPEGMTPDQLWEWFYGNGR